MSRSRSKTPPWGSPSRPERPGTTSGRGEVVNLDHAAIFPPPGNPRWCGRAHRPGNRPGRRCCSNEGGARLAPGLAHRGSCRLGRSRRSSAAHRRERRRVDGQGIGLHCGPAARGCRLRDHPRGRSRREPQDRRRVCRCDRDADDFPRPGSGPARSGAGRENRRRQSRSVGRLHRSRRLGNPVVTDTATAPPQWR